MEGEKDASEAKKIKEQACSLKPFTHVNSLQLKRKMSKVLRKKVKANESEKKEN